MSIVYKMTNGAVITQTETLHTGGYIQIQADGTFDGATLSMLVSQDGLEFVKLSDYEKTANDVSICNLKACRYYFDVSNAQSTTSIKVSVV